MRRRCRAGRPTRDRSPLRPCTAADAEKDTAAVQGDSEDDDVADERRYSTWDEQNRSARDAAAQAQKARLRQQEMRRAQAEVRFSTPPPTAPHGVLPALCAAIEADVTPMPGRHPDRKCP